MSGINKVTKATPNSALLSSSSGWDPSDGITCLHNDQENLGKQGAMVEDGVSWTRCVAIREHLTVEQRNALKMIAEGKAYSLNAADFEMLKCYRLVRRKGDAWEVTDDGRVIGFWS